MRHKRAQITLFVIIAILLVGGIIILIVALAPEVEETSLPPSGTTGFVQSCVEDAVKSSIQKVENGGGDVSPSKFILYNGKIHNYLCHTADYYVSCYNLYPSLEEFSEFQIREDTKVAVQDCFDSYRIALEDEGAGVIGGLTNYSINILPGKVDVSLEKQITIQMGSSSQIVSDFSFTVTSPLHGLIQTSREIVNSEADVCTFDYVTYMLLYPKFDIRRISYQDSRIYRVIDRASGEEFKFAVRSCAVPQGF